jgi:hypothetical protein
LVLETKEEEMAALRASQERDVHRFFAENDQFVGRWYNDKLRERQAAARAKVAGAFNGLYLSASVGKVVVGVLVALPAVVHVGSALLARGALLKGTTLLPTTGTGIIIRQASGGLAAAQARFAEFARLTGTQATGVMTKLAGRGSGQGSGGDLVHMVKDGAMRVILRASSTANRMPTIEIHKAGDPVTKIRFAP